MLKTILLAASLFAANAAVAGTSACDREVDETHFVETYSFKVTGKGRLYFHTSPNEKCINKKVFVIAGDYLSAHTTAGKKTDWVSVNYMDKDGEDYSGWVRTDRLQFTGASGGNMTDDDIKFYKKAMAAAKAGKMGVP